MSAVEVAFGSAWPAARPPRWVVGVLGVSIAVAGVMGLVLVFAGPSTYRDIADANDFAQVPFLVPANVAVERRHAVTYDTATRVALHEGTLRYVLSQDPGTPRDPSTRDPLFDADEQAHLADVRRVFTVMILLALAALFAIAATGLLFVRLGRRAVVRMMRDAAVCAAIVVGVVGASAAVAFEPAFLLFHRVFFPQGNFLFDPATSNLLRLYPESYWYGVTMRVGIAFVAAALLATAAATAALRVRASR